MDAAGNPAAVPVEAIDQAFLKGTLERLQRVLSHARHDISYFIEEIRSLTTQDELSPDYQVAYADIVTLLRPLESALQQAHKSDIARGEAFAPLFEHRDWRDAPPPPGLCEAAKRMIEQIDAAEMRMVECVADAQATLLARQPDGLFDWSMPFDFEITLLLHPGETRRFYDTCGDGDEPLRIPVPGYSPIPREKFDDYNWTPFWYNEGHPLQSCHMQHLARWIVEESALPWQLLPSIREIEVYLKLSDFEAMWPVADRQSSNRRVLVDAP